jgi:hypothetical protein
MVTLAACLRLFFLCALLLSHTRRMLPLNALLEIKAIAASDDGACIAAVRPLTRARFFDALNRKVLLNLSRNLVRCISNKLILPLAGDE